jgi:cytochrome b pre-mRNA-processing protein 3
MLRFLFPRLTAAPLRGAALFRWVTAEARAPHWYLAGEVPDTVDGRFAMLTTVAALVMARLERDSGAADSASVSLTERFVEAMTAEHREMGLGDPKLGRTVRALVGALARRVALWRSAVTEDDWSAAVCDSVYGADGAPDAALNHTSIALRRLWARLEAGADEAIADGRIE